MVSSKHFFQQYLHQITVYDLAESRAILLLVFEKIFSITRHQILADKQILLPCQDHISQLNDILRNINNNIPIQYLLGETEFYGKLFNVNPHVLIPRQETEELVRLILDEADTNDVLNILDIGTGSGCIAISLAIELSNSNVYAMDISDEALLVAKSNAIANKQQVSFIHHDILSNDDLAERLTCKMDIIVSNPPYIMENEKAEMLPHVLEHEPSLALFVNNENPLIFYKAIIQQAKKILKIKGKIYFEINEQMGEACKLLLLENDFVNVSIIKDLNSKDRIAKGEWRG